MAAKDELKSADSASAGIFRGFKVEQVLSQSDRTKSIAVLGRYDVFAIVGLWLSTASFKYRDNLQMG